MPRNRIFCRVQKFKKILFISLRAEASEVRTAPGSSWIWIYILNIIASVTSCLPCSKQTISKYSLIQWFSNFSVYQNPLEDFSRHRFLGPITGLYNWFGVWLANVQKFRVILMPLIQDSHNENLQFIQRQGK